MLPGRHIPKTATSSHGPCHSRALPKSASAPQYVLLLLYTHHDVDEDFQAGNDGYELAIHGDPNSWWLCPSHLNEVNVVYKPAENRGTVYDYDSCYPVLLKIVENSS